ncbi:MAG: trimeric intracellular cation channel family protein, partial [Actinomycetota bacterium]
MFAATSDALTISSSDAVLVVSVIGTVAFALSGVMAATEAGMDWLGGVVLAAVAAIGGGTIRDLLIDNRMFWIADEWPLIVSLVTAAVAILVLRARPSVDPRRASWYVASDAVGLGAFAVVGTSIALESGTSYFIAAFMGVITGVGGGVLRDVFARRMP